MQGSSKKRSNKRPAEDSRRSKAAEKKSNPGGYDANLNSAKVDAAFNSRVNKGRLQVNQLCGAIDQVLSYSKALNFPNLCGQDHLD